MSGDADLLVLDGTVLPIVNPTTFLEGLEPERK